jgi:cell wall-associated NlpC family hydrolase
MTNDGYWQLGDDQDIGSNLIRQAQEQTDRIAKDKAAADEAARQLALAQQSASAAASRSASRDDESASLNASLSSKPFDINSVTAAPPLSADQSARGQQIVAYALQFVGRPYVWGGTSPVTGWDCSGYVQYVYRNFGIQLPRVSGDQAAGGVHVAQSAAQPGDVIANGVHAAIYIGNGMVVNAANPSVGTIVSPLSSFPGSFTVTRYY